MAQEYPHMDGDFLVIGPECFTRRDVPVICWQGANYVDEAHVKAHMQRAIGYLSATLASRSGAWDGAAPGWFPPPPEWLALWNEALEATVDG